MTLAPGTDLASESATEFAAAKINLCLHVTGQRADGYHLLDSLVVFVGVGDRLTGRLSHAPRLALKGPFGATLTAGPDNLVLRAAALHEPAHPVSFTLEKNLPLASGIGGGSADAAAAVRLIDRLLGQNRWPAPEVARALAALGADIPVCLAQSPRRMSGIGEVLAPVAGLPPGWMVLVNPGVEVPTPAVFRALTHKHNAPLPTVLPVWGDLADLAAWLQQQRNDLEAPALHIAPVIGDVLARLRAQPGQRIARMSGSGATCFALFDHAEAAQTAAAAVQHANPGWWVAAAPLLV